MVNVGELADGPRTPTSKDVDTRTWAPSAMATPWGPDLDLNASRRCPLLDDAPPMCRASPTPIVGSCNCTSSITTRQQGWADGYAKFGDQLNASGVATHLWTAPFIQTVFGTDTYTDQLW